MNAAFLEPLVETPEPSVSCTNCPAVLRLERALEQLQRDFRLEVGYWKSQHAKAVQRIEQLTVELEQSRGQVRALQNKLFGRGLSEVWEAGRDDVGHGRFGGVGDRRAGAPATHSSATLSSGVRLRSRQTHVDGSAAAQTDSQRQLRRLDLGACLVGQVFVVSAHGTVARAT